MCGIAGIWDLSSPADLRTRIEAATRQVEHRGPDDEGFALLGKDAYSSWGGKVRGEGKGSSERLQLGIGHRRLSIIDLSAAGHQPLRSPDSRYWIVLNGEIYNYLELKAELQSLGMDFASRTDTEVVLSAFLAWGPACVERFNGMWSFAIFDRREETLFCSRDRFGVKPFNYAAWPGKFIFGSETKQLLGELGSKPQFNTETVADFLCWGFQGHRVDSFVNGIKRLPGGHSLLLSSDDVRAGRVVPTRYWNPAAEQRREFSDAAGRMKQLLEDSIRLRLRSDVPVGITLSGGLDSSSIVCLASNICSGVGAEPPRAFTVVYPGRKYSEEEYARAVADQCRLSLTVLRPTSDALAGDWERFVWAMDEPFDGLSYYSNWKIYQTIRSHGVPVLLNGQGGDELLLGYERYRVPFLVHLLRRGLVHTLMFESFRARRNANISVMKQASYALYFLLPRLRAARRLRVVRPYLRRDFYEVGRSRTDQLEEGSVCGEWPAFLLKEFERYQLPNLLHQEDCVSMHFGVEARSPFLDYRLFNFIIGQDIRYLLRGGWSKALVREGMRGVLPDVVRERRSKMGFNTPTQQLLKENASYFCEVFDRNDRDPILDVQVLKRDFLQGRINENFLCSALSFLSWRESLGIDGSGSVAA